MTGSRHVQETVLPPPHRRRARLHGNHAALLEGLDRQRARQLRRELLAAGRKSDLPLQVHAPDATRREGGSLEHARQLRAAGRFAERVAGLRRLPQDLEAAAFASLRWLDGSLQRDALRIDPEVPDPDLLLRIDRTRRVRLTLRNRLAEAFRGLAALLAARLTNARFSHEELLSEADQTLLLCLERFDPARGYRFSTYATLAIRRALYRHVMRTRGRESVSLESCSSEPSAKQVDSDHRQLRCWRTTQRLLECLQTELDDRERRVLASRLGLQGNLSDASFRAIAKPLGVSGERARQLYERALAKLRRLTRSWENPLDA